MQLARPHEMQAALSSISFQQFSLFGVRMDALTRADLVGLLSWACSTRQRLSILNHNLHSLYLYGADPVFREAYEIATHVYIDGMPVVWLCRAAGLALTSNHRITFLDCFEELLQEAAARGWRVFYLGSTAEVQQQAQRLIAQRFPGLVFRGRDGYFSKCEEGSRDVISDINAFCPDILFVGFGMPVQEKWLASWRRELRVPVALTSGATLDYLTGAAYRPPALVGALGLYGLFRLASDPKRLWRRYLVEPVQVMKYFLKYVRSQILVVNETHVAPADGLAFGAVLTAQKGTADTQRAFAKGAAE